MTLKIYLNILRGGVYASFLCLFFVFNGLLFPYITSKQIPFNILMEALGAILVIFLIRYPAYRPKFSYISFGLLAFFVALLVSTLASVDFNLSFWGDIERMLGWFHLFHFFILYGIIITVFRDWKNWRRLFIAFGLASVYVSLIGILQHFEIIQSSGGSGRVISTIGNAAYVGAFAIFSIFFALILERKESSRGLKIFYWIGMFLMFLSLVYSGTRGAYFGFAFGIMLMFFLFGIFSGKKIVKRFSFGALVFFIILIALIFGLKNSRFVISNSYLNRITSSNLSDATFQTRLISWKAAWKDFPSHPILGSGYGNFAITFDKYFEPEFYDHTRSETYFDRAHNNFIDLASTSGLAGLFTYLSIFAACFYYLIRGFRRGWIDLSEFSLLFSLIIAYFIQNLLVFDALATYIPLMIMLGYIHWRHEPGEAEMAESGSEVNAESSKDRQSGKMDQAAKAKSGMTASLAGETSGKDNNPGKWTAKKYAASGAAIILALVMIFHYNVNFLRMLKGTIDGQYVLAAKGDVGEAYVIYKKALDLDTPLNRDSAFTFVRSVIQFSNSLVKMDEAKRNEILDYAISQAEKVVSYNKADSMNQMILGQLYYTTSYFFENDPEKFNYYSSRAEEAINKSIKSSPGRVPIYYEMAQVYLSRGNADEAQKILAYAVTLNPRYPDSYCHLASVNLLSKNENAYANMDQCLDLSGEGALSNINIVLTAAAHYQEKEDWKRLTALVRRATELDPQNTEYLINLAQLYIQIGKKAEAIAAAQKAASIDPSLKSSAEEFVRQLGN